MGPLKEDRSETPTFRCGPVRSSRNRDLLGPGARPARSRPSADPYANNPEAGKQQFPLAAPAGKDSGAKTTPPRRRQRWSVRPRLEIWPQNAPPAGAKLWNPVMPNLKAGGKVTGGTVFSSTDPLTYCAMASAGYDFIWTEMQHNDRDWNQAARMWRTCPHAKAVPGVRLAYADEREIQHATDAGALVIVVPTVDTVEEAIEARNWTYFPPLGRRSQGGGQGFDAAMWGNSRAAIEPRPTTTSCSFS